MEGTDTSIKEALMSKIYDMIIIGGGPAGYTAALYAARAGLDTLILEKLTAGGQMVLTDVIDNYPGFGEGIEGFALGAKMREGAERFGAAAKSGNVTSVELVGEVKKIFTRRGEFSARTVVIATGAEPKKLGVDGEELLVGRGVHYCAHCDGGFYKDKTVAVVGGGNSAVSDALYLSRLARKVYLIHRRDSLRATKVYHKSLMEAGNIEFVWNSTVSGFKTDGGLSGVDIGNTVTSETRTLNVDGVFVSIGRKPSTDLFVGQVGLDEYGYIIADETTATNVKGVFAAGDVRTKALRQVVTAAADGAVAAHFAEEYLLGI